MTSGRIILPNCISQKPEGKWENEVPGHLIITDNDYLSLMRESLYLKEKR
jgi:hypothetical protein